MGFFTYFLGDPMRDLYPKGQGRFACYADSITWPICKSPSTTTSCFKVITETPYHPPLFRGLDTRKRRMTPDEIQEVPPGARWPNWPKGPSQKWPKWDSVEGFNAVQSLQCLPVGRSISCRLSRLLINTLPLGLWNLFQCKVLFVNKDYVDSQINRA